MKKWIKRTLAAVLSGVLLLSGANTAWATAVRDTNSNLTISNDAQNSDIGSFTLIKDYDSVNPTAAAPNSSSPAETFTFTIAKYHAWNTGYASQQDVPNFNPSTITITESKGDATYESGTESKHEGDKTATVTLPSYAYVGDYWYTLTETRGNTTGVYYGTNDGNTTEHATENGAHDQVYYLHVQVTKADSGTPELHRMVTLHKSAPGATSLTNQQYNANATQDTGKLYAAEDSNKVNMVENQYHAGDLVITKTVTGNAGDKEHYFPVTVVFTKPAGTVINSDITFTAPLLISNSYTSTDVTLWGQYKTGEIGANNLQWKNAAQTAVAAADDTNEAKATATFFVKDGTSVTFSNIPYGVTYTVSETLPSNDNYKNKLVFTAEDAATTFNGLSLAKDEGATTLDATDKNATGSISDTSDTITITNEKTTPIDIGVITEDAPFFAMLAVAGVAAVLLVVGKRKNTEV